MKSNENLKAGASAITATRGQPNPLRRILVLEDDASIRRLSAEALAFSGYQVVAVEDGADGWEALHANSYDLMITDNGMPRLTGVKLLKKLHAEEIPLPVIMATGTLPAGELARHPWLQPAATLLKPYTIVELLSTVKNVLRGTEKVDSQGGTTSR